jgi:N-acetylglutamate synthase-like GNAT family acetyltransferase
VIPRYATNEDVSELVRIINSAYRVEDFFVDGDRTSESDIASQMEDPTVRFLVVDSQEPTALAAAVLVDVHGNRGHFAMLSVDPPFQGRGLARLLVDAVEAHCRAAGCDALDIEIVNLREELPSFYVAMGFSPFDTAPFPDRGKLSRDAHLVLMRKSLVVATISEQHAQA